MPYKSVPLLTTVLVLAYSENKRIPSLFPQTTRRDKLACTVLHSVPPTFQLPSLCRRPLWGQLISEVKTTGGVKDEEQIKY